jgi:hypothetical protein
MLNRATWPHESKLVVYGKATRSHRVPGCRRTPTPNSQSARVISCTKIAPNIPGAGSQEAEILTVLALDGYTRKGDLRRIRKKSSIFPRLHLKAGREEVTKQPATRREYQHNCYKKTAREPLHALPPAKKLNLMQKHIRSLAKAPWLTPRWRILIFNGVIRKPQKFWLRFAQGNP